MSSDPSGPMDGFDAAGCLDRLAAETARAIGGLGRRGAVVATSGGIDSSVARGSASARWAPRRSSCCGFPSATSATRPLNSAPSWRSVSARAASRSRSRLRSRGSAATEQRDEAIRAVFPDYEPSWKHKLVRSAPSASITVFSLVVERPDGTQEQRRMPADAYLSLLAATNMKQRVRKLREYTWADRLSYAVIGHPEPARVRPGILRQGRRRARRREADRRPLQGPGLRAGARARPARGDRDAGSRPRRRSRCRRPRRSSTSATPTSAWTS